MLKIALPAVAALGLIAFAAGSQATDSDVQTLAPAMGWHLSYEGSMAKLAYGVANSDQLALMMTCERGAARAVVYGDVQPAGARMLRTSMSTAIDPLSGGLLEETAIPVSNPALRQLAGGGSLPVVAEAGQFELSATVAERRGIGEFFAYCGSGRV